MTPEGLLDLFLNSVYSAFIIIVFFSFLAGEESDISIIFLLKQSLHEADLIILSFSINVSKKTQGSEIL